MGNGGVVSVVMEATEGKGVGLKRVQVLAERRATRSDHAGNDAGPETSLPAIWLGRPLEPRSGVAEPVPLDEFSVSDRR